MTIQISKLQPNQMIRYVHVPKKIKQVQRQKDGSITLNQQNLRIICLIQGLYQYPELNNKLYLHFKSIIKIQNLQPYKNLKALYLQNNLIKKIENIACLSQLESLFLHNNMITDIQNIDCLQLKILNLSNNQIHKIQRLDHLRQLQTLTLSKNFLSSFESIQHLGLCSQTLTNIDLTDNKIEADDRIIPLFVNVKCLYLIGNPFVKEIGFYRRKMIGQLKNLVYLDEKGIDQQQRMISQAWVKDGEEGLKKVKGELQLIKAEQKAQRSKQLMKDVLIHKLKKIHLFKSAIDDSKMEIKKYLTFLMNTPMKDLYTSKIQEEQIKINQYTELLEGMEAYILEKSEKKISLE